MNLNCAILHADPEIAGRLEEYIDKVPFLSLHGKYGNPLEALKDYYETKVEVYFVGIYPVEEGEIDGMDFCRLLSSSTRVIFITDTDRYAAECFRLDALDYLMDGLNFSTFFPVCQQSGTLVLFAGCRYVRLQTQARSGRGSEGDLHAV